MIYSPVRNLGFFLLVIVAAVGKTIPCSEAHGIDSALSLVHTLMTRLDLEADCENSLAEAIKADPDADFWATVVHDTCISASLDHVKTSSHPQLMRKLQEGAVRKTQFLAMLAAFFPDIQERLILSGYRQSGAQRRALVRLVGNDQIRAMVDAGSVMASDVTDSLAATVQRVPRAAVTLLAQGMLATEMLHEAYTQGLREEAFAMLAEEKYDEALCLFRELQDHTALSVDDRLAVARCFAEIDKGEDATAIIKAIMLELSSDSENLLKCGDIALMASDDSLAIFCYEQSSRALVGDFESAETPSNLPADQGK